MNLKSRNDYITDGIASLLWHGIEQGTVYPQLLELVNTTFSPCTGGIGGGNRPFYR